jgi:hypothetical protein
VNRRSSKEKWTFFLTLEVAIKHRPHVARFSATLALAKARGNQIVYE